MSEKKVLPIFMGEGDEQIQIGMAEVQERESSVYQDVFIAIDVFAPGELATLTRVVRMDHVKAVSLAYYPKKHKFKVDDQIAVCEPQSAWYGHRGKIITVMPDHYRVMFLGVEGYSIFTEDELTEAI